MPLYEYECSACGHRFEVIQRFIDPPVGTCVACGQGPVLKLLSAPAVHFKGTGWYVTDYANKKSDGAAKADDGAAKSGSASSDSSSPAAAPASGDDKKPAAATAPKPAQDNSK